MPIWVYILDYILGIVMYTLIGRAAMNIFQREDSNFFFMRIFVKFTNPVLKIFDKITPEFLARPIVPLYVAFYFYLNKILFNAVVIRIWVYGHVIFSYRS